LLYKKIKPIGLSSNRKGHTENIILRNG